MPIKALVTRYPALIFCRNEMSAAFEQWKACFRHGGKLLVCGNGGSAADSEHMVGELMKGYLRRRPLTTNQQAPFADSEQGAYLIEHLQGALPAISLVSQTSLVSAISNDIGEDMVFAQQVYGYGRKGDVLVGFSTSGNSLNVIRAMEVAKALGMHTTAFTGQDKGMLGDIADIALSVPTQSTPQVQELHLPIYHTLCEMIESEFFNE